MSTTDATAGPRRARYQTTGGAEILVTDNPARHEVTRTCTGCHRTETSWYGSYFDLAQGLDDSWNRIVENAQTHGRACAALPA